ncbi:asparagine synthase (glutamine-hydrolyzing) [Bordetella avium]|uniref:asparagine synthase (glutamine-hydrolyzing) n=1 Tax=Bordetella avium TaxID=521 RepID=UPI000E67A30F|nr:asparagine synthase (glutamine-hydrolyzing) [Bordetella avium]RIQ16792.1 asparagine synthase (glutamine-hydrolyzing) [Bordetella avium]RIQ35126.1 asparagine synthase (glutamine-hydrolyzing) [Bordetella avium]
MCGIVGLWGPLEDKTRILAESCQRIRLRGPDSKGFWEDREAGVGFGHVRLAIQDLTEAGHQPMVSACGRYVLTYNGEVYNHLDMRAKLEQAGQAPDWRGHSDTETILAYAAAFGVQAMLRDAVGMLAIALWDRQTRSLTLARDRMGEKPLYYGYVGANLVFASQLKGLSPVPGFGRQIDRNALASFMRHNYVPAPQSIYEGIRKLPAASWVVFSEAQLRAREMAPPQAYWSALEVADAGQRQPRRFASDNEAADALQEVLLQAVRGQMLSDVRLGAFLSGGIDSSTIAALMQSQSNTPVRTFAIGFHEKEYDEAQHAKAVAAHLGTDHSELYVTPKDALDVVPHLADIYDEPFADSSQIPTALVTRMAREHVTVALSGDGGDELFGGYSRYLRVARWWDQCERLPAPLRALAGAAMRGSTRLPGAGAWRGKVGKMGELLRARSQGEFYRLFVSYWSDPARVVKGGEEPPSLFEQPLSGPLFEAMMKLDTVTYMPDDILVKVDRAAMAVSLETRVPLIDHRVYEFAWSLPFNYKLRGGTGKWLLRQVLYRHVPQSLVDRPKRGFAVPLASWLRGPLRDWAEALLDPARLRQQGWFEPEPILRKWREHQSGHRNWDSHLWGVLMMQAWLDRYHSGQLGEGMDP